MTVRLFSCNRFFYLDATNGAAVATRSLMEGMTRSGHQAQVLCGPIIDAGREEDPASLLARRGLDFRVGGLDRVTVAPAGSAAAEPEHLRLEVGGVPVTVHRRPLQKYKDPGPVEAGEFLRLFQSAVDRFRPTVLVTYGGDSLTREILSRARRAGIATVFCLHNHYYNDKKYFEFAGSIVVPSRFTADYYSRKLGLSCVALPNVIDHERIQVRDGDADPRFVTFVNPAVEKGVFPFARIADELGRRRPDIPLLVVEGRGTESTLAACGLDLRVHGNVHLMSHTSNPLQFWRATRICIMPSLFCESQGLVAVEAMINGIPVVGSDRGALPETLGEAGVLLPLPERLTPDARILPSPEEVGPWVEAVIRLWDDVEWYADRSRKSIEEARKWSPEILIPRYVELFRGLTSSVSGKIFSS